MSEGRGSEIERSGFVDGWCSSRVAEVACTVMPQLAKV